MKNGDGLERFPELICNYIYFEWMCDINEHGNPYMKQQINK